MKALMMFATAGVLAAGAAMPAHGGDALYFDMYTTGSGACQAALPAFEGQVRKRPLALQNEGTAPAFVSCSPHQFLSLYDATYGVRLEIVNIGSAAASVTCTAVNVNAEAPEYIPKTVEVAAGSNAAMDFSESVDGFSFGSFSCNLPVGTGIGFIAPYSGAVYTPPPA